MDHPYARKGVCHQQSVIIDLLPFCRSGSRIDEPSAGSTKVKYTKVSIDGGWKHFMDSFPYMQAAGLSLSHSTTSTDLRINSFLMNNCVNSRINLMLTSGNESGEPITVPVPSGPYGPLALMPPSSAKGACSGLGPSLSMAAQYMPYLSGLSHMDLLQHYATLAASAECGGPGSLSYRSPFASSLMHHSTCDSSSSRPILAEIDKAMADSVPSR